MIHPPRPERLPERLCDVVLAFDLGERRRPVAAVQRQARRGATGPARVHRNGAGHVACHDLTLAVPVRTPRTPARARVPLLPSGPGGVGGISAVRGVADQSSHGWGQVAPHPGGPGRRHRPWARGAPRPGWRPRTAGPGSRPGPAGATATAWSGELVPHAASGRSLTPVSLPAEDSPSGLGRTLGKRVGGNPSGVRISYPPPA